jgi:hypothetical protein
VPRGRPHKNESSAEKGNIKILAIHLKPTIPRIAATDVGIPPPLQLCDLDRIKLDISPIDAAPRISKGRYIGFSRTVPYKNADK